MKSRCLPLVGILAWCVVAACGGSGSNPASNAGPNDEATPPPAPSSPPTVSVTDPPDSGDDPPPEVDSGPPPELPCNLPVDKTGFVGQQTFTFRVDDRNYQLYVADKYDGTTKMPVMLVFHGDGGTGEIIRSWTHMEDAANGNMIFVYPDGKWGTWDIDSPPATNDDYPYVEALINDVASRLCIDRKRVFGWGLSKGAFFVNNLGCFEGNVIRGIIAHSGGGPSSASPDDYDATGHYKCTTAPSSSLSIHGDLDTIVSYSTAIDSRNHWIWANGCSTSYQAMSPSPCVLYDGCKGGNQVAWCENGDMGHDFWDGSIEATMNFVNMLK